jgi:hypothetical protein
MKPHPLEKIVKRHFGVTDSLEETGYVLSDGTFLDLSGRHMAEGYERKGDRFVPKKRRPDYLANQRSIDHRQLPSELFDAVGTREGSAAMFKFLRKTGALRLMPGAGFLVAKMPTVESVVRVVREWHHAFGDEPLYVDVVYPGSRPDRASRVIDPDDVRESQEFERPTVEEVMEFLESKFGSGASMGARDTTLKGDGWVWAYHVTSERFIPSIAQHGLRPTIHQHVPGGAPVLFVEPDLAGVEPYWHPGLAVLRFKTPGFASTEDGEDVLFGGEPPFVGDPGAIPPEALFILVGKRFQRLVES